MYRLYSLVAVPNIASFEKVPGTSRVVVTTKKAQTATRRNSRSACDNTNNPPVPQLVQRARSFPRTSRRYVGMPKRVVK